MFVLGLTKFAGAYANVSGTCQSSLEVSFVARAIGIRTQSVGCERGFVGKSFVNFELAFSHHMKMNMLLPGKLSHLYGYNKER